MCMTRSGLALVLLALHFGQKLCRPPQCHGLRGDGSCTHWQVERKKRASTSPVNAVVRETIYGKAGPFSVERLKMDLSFANVPCAQTSTHRSAGPLSASHDRSGWLSSAPLCLVLCYLLLPPSPALSAPTLPPACLLRPASLLLFSLASHCCPSSSLLGTTSRSRCTRTSSSGRSTS